MEKAFNEKISQDKGLNEKMSHMEQDLKGVLKLDEENKERKKESQNKAISRVYENNNKELKKDRTV